MSFIFLILDGFFVEFSLFVFQSKSCCESCKSESSTLVLVLKDFYDFDNRKSSEFRESFDTFYLSTCCLGPNVQGEQYAVLFNSIPKTMHNDD